MGKSCVTDLCVCETVVCDNVVLLVLNLSNFKWSLAAVMNELLGLGSSGLRSNQAGSNIPGKVTLHCLKEGPQMVQMLR